VNGLTTKYTKIDVVAHASDERDRKKKEQDKPKELQIG